MSAPIPGEQRQVALLDGDPLEGVSNYLGLMFVPNYQGTEESRSRINLTHSTASRPQSCLWSRREISFRTKGRVYQVVVCSILPYGCEMWWVRVVDENMLAVFDYDNISYILHVRRIDCIPSVEHVYQYN